MMLSMDQVNAMGFEQFTDIFGNIIEHCPMLAAGVWDHRPFLDVNSIRSALQNLIDQLPTEARAGILRCHPDLAGKLAQSDELTTESKNEQKAAGLDTMTAEEKIELQANNERYKQKFGFPFVIVARENKKETIMKQIVVRYSNSLEEELRTAIEEVKKIGYLRLTNIIDPSSTSKL